MGILGDGCMNRQLVYLGLSIVEPIESLGVDLVGEGWSEGSRGGVNCV